MLNEIFKNSKIKNYLVYIPQSDNGRSGLETKLNKGQKEISKGEKFIQADLKTAEDISKSFDDIIKLFYEIDKHKKQKKQMGGNFGGSKTFDSSSTVSTLKKDFFVSKVNTTSNEFTNSLSEVIDEFFESYLKFGIGLIPLIDAFVEFNNHRGTDIVSCQDFRNSCELLNNSPSKYIIIYSGIMG